jgi:hypothetical protein
MRRRKAFPGIRIRISTQNGVVFDGDSQHLHYAAKYAGDGWLDLIAGGDHGALEFSQVPVKIEVRPAMLEDPPIPSAGFLRIMRKAIAGTARTGHGPADYGEHA